MSSPTGSAGPLSRRPRHPFGARIFLGTVLIAAAAVFGSAQGCASAKGADPTAGIPSGWPVERKIASVSSNFGARRNSSWHQGIDLSAPEGTPVRATARGKVKIAERSRAYGRTVVIDHGNGLRTRYAHLKRIAVETGERVNRGEVVGKVGKSGNASGFHLHYEVIRNGSPIDPRPYLD